MDAMEAIVRFGILQRYVMGEILRSFLLALITITTIFVLFIVMAAAADKGLGPLDIARLVPYLTPMSLPYTVPVSLLFAVSVVYGRIASDNEIIAIKSAGLSAMTVIKPAWFLGICVAILLTYCSMDIIPRSNLTATKFFFKNVEDFFYKVLKKDREFNNSNWPFLIKVKDVEGRIMHKAVFKRRVKGSPNSFDMVVSAERATIDFVFDKQKILVTLEEATVSEGSSKGNVALLDGNKGFEFPMPGSGGLLEEKKIPEMTWWELDAEYALNQKLIAEERIKQSVAAAMNFGSGRFYRINWREVQDAYLKYDFWEMKCYQFETEQYMRVALASGSFFFIALGAPVGILFARRDFLSAFMTCFIPIILIYYPLTIFGMSLSKEGIIPPGFVLMGNLVLGLLAGFVAMPPVRQH